ncbi:hypothetical protein RPMD05_44 [Rhodobacteraceae phage LS06-2018-MD05]|nr:hypothetical protein RPMD05_44 [Rhodobacteraceae phage LS06-2018-MD05]
MKKGNFRLLLRNLRKMHESKQLNIGCVVHSTFGIYCEGYSRSTESTFDLDMEFKSEDKAIKYLKKKVGKLKRFNHEWSKRAGKWYEPETNPRYGFRKYYLIYEK